MGVCTFPDKSAFHLRYCSICRQNSADAKTAYRAGVEARNVLRRAQNEARWTAKSVNALVRKLVRNGRRVSVAQERAARELAQSNRQQRCAIQGCDRPWFCLEWCRGHYEAQRKGRELKPLRVWYRGAKCAIPFCQRKSVARGRCQSHYFFEFYHRRRRRNGGTFTLQEFLDLCDRYGNCCLACGRSDVKLTADHVVPVSAGGWNGISNIQPLCRPCNSSKNARTIDYRYFVNFVTSQI